MVPIQKRSFKQTTFFLVLSKGYAIQAKLLILPVNEKSSPPMLKRPLLSIGFPDAPCLVLVSRLESIYNGSSFFLRYLRYTRLYKVLCEI
jgi:hypothetical protein